MRRRCGRWWGVRDLDPFPAGCDRPEKGLGLFEPAIHTPGDSTRCDRGLEGALIAAPGSASIGHDHLSHAPPYRRLPMRRRALCDVCRAKSRPLPLPHVPEGDRLALL